MILSSALVYSTRPPVSVYGTGQRKICLAGFLGSRITISVRSAGASRYCPVSSYSVYLTAPYITTRFNVLFRQHADVSLLRRRITLAPGAGILTGWPSDDASRLVLRSRLTLIRLALIRNPWSFGGRVSRPPYRYLYLHLLFRILQRHSRVAFCGNRNAPLPIITKMTIPRLRQRAYARLLSMQGRLTSELLRTL